MNSLMSLTQSEQPLSYSFPSVLVSQKLKWSKQQEKKRICKVSQPLPTCNKMKTNVLTSTNSTTSN